LARILDELDLHNCNREIFLGLDLNQKTEELFRGDIKSIKSQVTELKREFILIIGSI
jgi:16S rRNA C1402 (ribose-2'-O) methylase RsmI